MHKDFCRELGNKNYDDEALLVVDGDTEDNESLETQVFWENDEVEINYESVCKPIRTPRQNRTFGMDGYNSHPKQHLDR